MVLQTEGTAEAKARRLERVEENRCWAKAGWLCSYWEVMWQRSPQSWSLGSGKGC